MPLSGRPRVLWNRTVTWWSRRWFRDSDALQDPPQPPQAAQSNRIKMPIFSQIKLLYCDPW